jgi:hypothetical protein
MKSTGKLIHLNFAGAGLMAPEVVNAFKGAADDMGLRLACRPESAADERSFVPKSVTVIAESLRSEVDSEGLVRHDDERLWRMFASSDGAHGRWVGQSACLLRRTCHTALLCRLDVRTEVL